MLHAFLKAGSFQDSVSLMLLSRSLSDAPDVKRVSVMMGTPANKDVFRETGMGHPLLETATPNDICVVIDSEDEEGIIEKVRARLEEGLASLAQGRRKQTVPRARSWRRAKEMAPDANFALISIAGAFADQPARQALADGCHVMLFSDNVSVETELALKQEGRERGLLVMGPDCGTAIIGGTPLAFANVVPKGPIGVVGASGTGTQEVTCQIAGLDSGITHAIGLGGRDLSSAIGGMSALTSLEWLALDPETKVITFVSKPPAPEVRAKVMEKMQTLGKPVVALFLGENPPKRRIGNVHLTYTLDETAEVAVSLARVEEKRATLADVTGKKVRGLYSGGTLANESAMLLAEALGLKTDAEHAEGYMLHDDGHILIDLGDDMYTRGRPHPMIDPSLRCEMIEALAKENDVGVIMVDVVLGYGSHVDPAGEVARAVKAMKSQRAANHTIVVVATVTGTVGDPQDTEAQISALEAEGIVIASSTREAVLLASRLVTESHPLSGKIPDLVSKPLSVINIGLPAFADDLQKNGTEVVHYQWAPIAGGNEHMHRLLELLQ